MDKMRLLMEDEKKKVQLSHKTNPEVGEETTELWFGEEYKCKVVEKGDMLRVKVHYKGSYLIFVIFFTRAKFLENKIYTEIYTVNCHFTQ